MKSLLAVFAGATLVAAVTTAYAEPYVDYTPQKGLWHVTTMMVEPNHIDDYLVGLKKTWVPVEEVAKKRGLIDSYSIMTKMNSDARGNVVLVEHIPNMALMEPDRARDESIMKEVYATMPKAEGQAKMTEFEKYRTFVSEDYYSDISFTK